MISGRVLVPGRINEVMYSAFSLHKYTDQLTGYAVYFLRDCRLDESGYNSMTSDLVRPTTQTSIETQFPQ